MARRVVFLILAFAVGLIVGSVLMRIDGGPETTPVPGDGGPGVNGPADPQDGAKPSTPAETTTPSLADHAAAPLQEENRGLHLRITELEGELELARERLAAVDGGGTPGEADSAPADFEAEFDELVKGGLGAYTGADFRKFIERLKEMGPEGYAFLYDLLNGSDDAATCFLAGAALEGIGDPAAIPALSDVLTEEKDFIVRRMASHAIAVLGTEEALMPLRDAMLADTDWGVRVNSAYGIAKAGGTDGLDYLQEAYLSEDTPDEYLLAILGGLADVAAPSTAPLFRKILGDTRDPTYLFIAIGALKKMKDQAALTELRRIVDSDLPESVRNAAADAIEALE